MGLMTRIADKAGALGSVVSAMGCAACFPATASSGRGHRPRLSTGIRRVVYLQAAAAVRSRGFAGECTGLAESSAMAPQPARDGRPSHRAGGHALVFWQLVDGEPPLCRSGLDGRGVDRHCCK